ncbi:pseudouridylate synthase 1 homolog isoform X2 [Bemisia tabaci]|uniref:pseudouridylate synthase 1 homolog isoform X2 n=1 Tax=Bemisia tabaci TaxID=7038 RepID=UPI003B280FA0
MIKFLRNNIAPVSSLFLTKVKMSEAISASSLNEKQESLKRSHEEDDVNEANKKTKVNRKKMAIVLGYCGEGYHGLQRNKGTKTVEEDIMNALLKAGAIGDDVFETAQLMSFQRAARTDKGVSALRQTLSLKLPVDVDIKSIAQHLPEQIRIFGMKRVTKGFNSKNSCDGRTYSYTCPSFAFAPSNVEPSEEYRIDPDSLSNVNNILKMYEGTKCFYNFTAKRRPNDPSCNRYMKHIACSEPYMKDGLELVEITVKGQSFMLHQIRKMVGLVMAISRGITSVETMTKAFQTLKLDLPTAPALGLMLEQVHYDSYNKRFGSDGMHEALDWAEFESEIQEFKDKVLIPHIVKTEKAEKTTLYFITQELPRHTFNVRDEAAEECAGLLALGKAANLIESEDKSNDSYLNDNLNTLAQAAQSVSPEKFNSKSD